MHHIQVGREILKFCFSPCVYEEYVINMFTVKEALVVNIRIYVSVFKLFYIKGVIRRGCNCTPDRNICL